MAITAHTLLDYNAQDLYPKTAVEFLFYSGTEDKYKMSGAYVSGEDLIKRITLESITYSSTASDYTDSTTSGPVVLKNNGDIWSLFRIGRDAAHDNTKRNLFFLSENNTYVGFYSNLFTWDTNGINLKYDSEFLRVDASKGLSLTSKIGGLVNPSSSISTPGDDDYILQANHSSGDWVFSYAKKSDVSGKVTVKQCDSSTLAYYIVGTKSTVQEDASTLYKSYTDDTHTIYWKNYNLYQTSDENLKDYVSDIDIDFDNLAQIKKMKFTWKSDEDKITDIGVTAQSVEALYPELITEEHGIKSVAYDKLAVIALAAVDKLYDRIKVLEDAVESLTNELDNERNQ